MTSICEARIASPLSDRAQLAPERVALVEGERELRYGELAARASAVGRGLQESGLRPGDRATVFLDKTSDAVASLYGVWLAGGVAVPANEGLKARQLDHVLRHSGSRCLVTHTRKLAGVGLDVPHGIDVVLVDGLRGAGDVEPVGEGGGAGGGEPAVILYTSGSTGRPKGIVLSHENLLAGARIVAGYLDLSENDRILSVLPFGFDYGLNQMLCSVRCGATLVLQRSHFPADICRSLVQQRITGLAGVPPLWVQLMLPTSPLARMELPDLRYVTNSGGAFPVELLRRYRAHLPHVRIYLMYGLTEAFRSTYLPPERVDDLPGSIGKAIPETEVFLVDSDGRVCEPGEVGELVHRGPTVSLGYWRDPIATARIFRPDPRASGSGERVVYSGDLARTDREGFLYYVGRRDQLLKCHGQRVNPQEVEEVLLASALLQEAVVHGEPDEVTGTRIVAHVVPRSGASFSEAELLKWCRREMPGHMVPARIVEHASFPRTPSLKIDRERVRG